MSEGEDQQIQDQTNPNDTAIDDEKNRNDDSQ